jgi:DUF1680 family protein
MKLPLRSLPLGAIRPGGWLLAQMQRDLEVGFAGCLDALTEHAATNLFARRIESSVQQFAWWDSETRGNWLWGYTLMAFLADVPEHQARVRTLLGSLRDTQDADGYLGIYSPAARYRHGDEENGELWAQSRALLPLLAYYEFTGDESFLRAVRAAVDLTLAHYGPGRPHFRRPRTGDAPIGMMHGLCYVDVVDWLFQITQDARYREFGEWLYDDFSRLPVPFPNDDMVPANLRDPHRPFRGHAVHTVEHLRALLVGASADRPLIDSALGKLRLYATPSGAVVGDEDIHGLPTPDAGYEYCTLTELLFSLTSAAQKLGQADLGDWIERLAFNAGQGARTADGRAVSYLTSDSRLAATADRPDSYSHLHGKHGRFKLSPTHEDVACCCNPNAVRLLPHYVSRMWLRTDEGAGLVAITYGACEVVTQVAGVRVTVTEQTDYPFEDRVRFTVTPERPVRFSLYLRVPSSARSVRIEGAEARVEGDYQVVERMWTAGDSMTLVLELPVRLQVYPTGEYAVHRGALQFVLPLDHEVRQLRTYPREGFADMELRPRDVAQGCAPVVLDAAQPDYGLTLERVLPVDGRQVWEFAPLRLVGRGRSLVPMGCAPLRRAAFALRPA